MMKPTLWLPLAVWCQGDQSRITGGSSRKIGELVGDHLLVGAPHALRVDHALGHAGGAGGEQHLGDRVGPDLGVRRIDRRRWAWSASRSANAVDLALGGRIAGDDHLEVGRHHRLDGALEGAAVGGEHEARGQQLEHVAQLAVVLRDQRVGRRDRHVGHADVERGKRQQRVLDVVAGQDGDRPLGREAAREQRRADAPRLVERLGVGDAAPAALVVALREQHPVGSALRPSIRAAR